MILESRGEGNLNGELVANHFVFSFEVIDVLNRAMGRDVGVTGISWRFRFHCDERQVARYRIGRIFLAGDSAHVHSPTVAGSFAGGVQPRSGRREATPGGGGQR